MPLLELQYPTEPYSTVKRYKERASYALETIHQIVNTCPVLHVAFQPPDSPFPAVLPMIGQMGSFKRPSADLGEVLDLYLHGYVSSRLMNLARAPSGSGSSSSSSSSSTATPTPAGLPLTVSAAHVDGLVLALTPNSHSYNYRSAVLFGHAEPVTDPAEKLYAMELVTDGAAAPGRWAATRVPPNAAEMQSTTILRVRVASGSAKIRSGGPHDDRGDMQDAELKQRVWTGVVPVYTTFGEPVPGGYNEVAEVPGYLEEWRREANKEAEEFAREQASEKKG